MLKLQNPESEKAKTKKVKADTAVTAGPFVQARKIFWSNPKQDKATFLAACEAAGMNPLTAKTRFYCLTTDRDASCSDATLRGV